MNFQYQKNNDFETRKKESENLLKTHIDKLPIILEKDPACKIEKLQKTKYLLSKNSTISELMVLIKKKTKISEGEALFLQARTKYSLQAESTIEEIYEKFKNNDGFLYIMYTAELIMG